MEDLKDGMNTISTAMEAEIADALRRGASPQDIDDIRDRYEREREELARRLQAMKDEQLAKLRGRMLKNKAVPDSVVLENTAAVALFVVVFWFLTHAWFLFSHCIVCFFEGLMLKRLLRLKCCKQKLMVQLTMNSIDSVNSFVSCPLP